MKHGTFDEMTRVLATSTSRRQALRRIAGMLAGGAVGGAALAEFSPGVALADGGNSDCAHFCNAIFAPGSARGQCKDDAAHGTGLCYTCGPKSAGGSQAICCSTNADGTCTSYSSATCCGSGQTCQSGTCVACLCNGTCPTPCSPLLSSCGSCGNGRCYQDVSGAMYCTNATFAGSCGSDCDCAQGYFCYVGTPFVGSQCTPIC